MRLALDAMGGDIGVSAMVEGAARASLLPGPDILLVGHRDAIASALNLYAHDPARLEIAHAPGFVPMQSDAKQALDTPGNSIELAARLVEKGEARGLVSAGHTGATVLVSSRIFKKIPGISRAALAAVYPTREAHGPKKDPFGLMLDVGATLSASPEELVGFAVMGSAYAKIIAQNPVPKVALLSNGTEPNRGTPEIIAAHQLLAAHPSLRFIGNIEGLDIAKGTADVVVCSGFIGNVVLKMLEGFYEVAVSVAKEAADSNLVWRFGMLMLSDGIQQIRTMTDWKQYGGAPLLGFDKVVIKAHGRSNARAVRNALKVAERAVQGDLVGMIGRGV
jgi:glycerol-3-phosphate acyltransferase PlsX